MNNKILRLYDDTEITTKVTVLDNTPKRLDYRFDAGYFYCPYIPLTVDTDKEKE